MILKLFKPLKDMVLSSVFNYIGFCSNLVISINKCKDLHETYPINVLLRLNQCCVTSVIGYEGAVSHSIIHIYIVVARQTKSNTQNMRLALRIYNVVVELLKKTRISS